MKRKERKIKANTQGTGMVKMTSHTCYSCSCSGTRHVRSKMNLP